MKTLLQKAKAVSVSAKHAGKKPSAEEVELMLAYLSGAVTGTQVAVAIGKPRTNHTVAIIYWAWSVLRGAYENNMISIKEQK